MDKHLLVVASCFLPACLPACLPALLPTVGHSPVALHGWLSRRKLTGFFVLEYPTLSQLSREGEGKKESEYPCTVWSRRPIITTRFYPPVVLAGLNDGHGECNNDPLGLLSLEGISGVLACLRKTWTAGKIPLAAACCRPPPAELPHRICADIYCLYTYIWPCPRKVPAPLRGPPARAHTPSTHWHAYSS